ncbi:MAG: hypothetical protein ACPL6F_04460, partial [Anaerolineales bacterium]
MLAVVGLLLFVCILGLGLVGFTYWELHHQHIFIHHSFPLDLGVYFLLIGFGYMLVELPLIQRFQLYLVHPAYSMAIVLFTILIFSGIGSILGKNIPLTLAMASVGLWWGVIPLGLSALFQTTLQYPSLLRAMIMLLVIAPGSFFMGCAFPGGLKIWRANHFEQRSLPLIWAINGAASVIASVAAMLLALELGFQRVLLLGAFCYACASLMVWKKEQHSGQPQSTGQK